MEKKKQPKKPQGGDAIASAKKLGQQIQVNWSQ